MDELRVWLSPHYAVIKSVHVLVAAIWSFSTSVAWVWYLKPALRRARRKPDDPKARQVRDHMMEAFDRGAMLEHVAFAILVLTAILMLIAGGFDLMRWSYVTAMFWIGIFLIVPMEIVDIHLSHLGGNKKRIRSSGDMELYERKMGQHWAFLRISEPVVIVLIPLMFFIAIVKPF
ncbi:MAG: hypothetical protein GY937_09950 [bacterium]|nr:hypothetical protein [bacterium]